MIISNQHLEMYQNYLTTAKYSNNVRKNYTYYVKGLLGYDLNDSTVMKLCRDKHAIYRSFLRTFVKSIGSDVEVPIIRGRREEKAVTFFTEKEMDTIRERVKDNKLGLLIRLLSEDGLRISEAVELRKGSFDLVNGRVKGKGKGGKEFDMGILKGTLESLKVYLKDMDKADNPFTWEGIKNQRQKALYEIKKVIHKVLPYKEMEQINCHMFRHTCGTHMRHKGFDLREIQVYLRHKQLETVARYTAVDKQELERKVQATF